MPNNIRPVPTVSNETLLCRFFALFFISCALLVFVCTLAGRSPAPLTFTRALAFGAVTLTIGLLFQLCAVIKKRASRRRADIR